MCVFSEKTNHEKFPLIQLPRKSEEALSIYDESAFPMFPLIQLPRKSEVDVLLGNISRYVVSINSTSEEVRSSAGYCSPGSPAYLVSINSTSEEVRS